MYFITITNITDSIAKSMSFITKMSCSYDNRFKRYEFRGSKQKHYKFIGLFKELAKLYKGEIYDWVGVDKYSQNIYREIN